MSTLPGLASKGEKGKSKYQSLDINNLYKFYIAEPLETAQQKNTLPRKHGMQSLGKVPTARRPPANLPSLKSEHTGSDTAVSLVPSGGAGWGKQDPNSPSTTPSSAINTNTNNTSTPATSAPPPAQNNTTPPTQNQIAAPAAAAQAQAASVAAATSKPSPPPSAVPAGSTDKSWSAIMSSGGAAAANANAADSHPPPYHSPQFQHEFPSLEGGGGGAAAANNSSGGAPRPAPASACVAPPSADAQYGPGPSLRPQTEGSWMQGGSRGGAEPTAKGGNGGGGPAQAVPLPPSVPGGPQAVAAASAAAASHFRGLISPFAYKGNFGSGANFANIPATASNNNNNARNNRNGPENGKRSEGDEAQLLLHRPIIKEEDLNRMDAMTRDVGWASHDDIDYNQKLAFSDDENEDKASAHQQQQQQRNNNSNNNAERHHDEMPHNNMSNNKWSSSSSKPNVVTPPVRTRPNEESDMWVQRRRQHSEEVALAVMRAKQRKDEEEKRFVESKQAAAKKLQQLEEKLNRKREGREDESHGMQPQQQQQQQQQVASIPVPQWDTMNVQSESDFRKLTQIEGRNLIRKETPPTTGTTSTRNADQRDSRDSRERGDGREPTGPSFSKQFQSNLPPRFQKQQQQLRSTTTSSSSSSTSQSFGESQYDSRWQHQSNHQFSKGAPMRKTTTRPTDDDYDYIREQHDDDRNKDVYDAFRSYNDVKEESGRSEDDKVEKKIETYEEKGEQRPDSRDSRMSRDSMVREVDAREYHGSWADSPFDAYDERRKEYNREDRRAVPGPITKERVEAEDIKSEKRNLTQMKRTYAQEKKSVELKREKESAWAEVKKDEGNGSSVWAETPPAAPGDAEKKMDACETKKDEEKGVDKEREERRAHSSSRRRGGGGDPRQNWNNGGGFVYRNTWTKKVDPRRINRPAKKVTRGGDFHGTDSDVSGEEIVAATSGDATKSQQQRGSPKVMRKHDKDDRNKELKQQQQGGTERRRDNYVPRGEPSRHGRGASNFRSSRVGGGGGGGGGLTKRIDGYGPPSSKSPFGQLEERREDAAALQQASAEGKGREPSSNASKPLKEANFMQQTGADDKEARAQRNTMGKFKGKRGEEGGVEGDTTSDNSDESALRERRAKPLGGSKMGGGMRAMGNASSSRHAQSRYTSDKRSYSNSRREDSLNGRHSSNGSLKSYGTSGKKDFKSNEPLKSEQTTTTTTESSSIAKAIVDEGEGENEYGAVCDADGFQEVKAKKATVRVKSDEKLPTKKTDKDAKVEVKKSLTSSNGGSSSANKVTLTPQQIANIPSLMDTPINPPAIVPPPTTSNKVQFERARQNPLPPRFAKQRENSRLQKAQMQQGICDVDLNKVNHINMYGLKEQNASASIGNAWEKPLSQLRNDQDILAVAIDNTKVDQSQLASQSNSPNMEKMIGKANHLAEKTVLDGTTPPVNTIIFENTNFKSAPARPPSQKCTSKLDEADMDNAVICNFNKPMRDLLNKNDKSEMQMPLAFVKEDSADMKLDFFESEISHLTEEKNSKSVGHARSMHITSVNSTISASTADALNSKIAAVKRVWEMPTVAENAASQDDANSSFASSFGADPNTLDASNAFNKTDPNDVDVGHHEGYSPSPNPITGNNNTNVCKVKPTQQVTNASQAAVHAVTTHHQPHSALVGGPGGLVGHTLSPPPLPPVLGGGVGLGQPPQQNTYNQHLGYQPTIGGSTQYGISAIPSPPTVLFNSQTQPLQAQTAGLYGAFQIDQSQVLGGQGRSQYSQYSNPYSLSQTAPSPYSAQSMYMQGAQPHPPTPQAPHDLYQNINSYRLPTNGPFGQNQQMNNPTTMLISSTSNSLMSATVKPSTQQISAIGTKAGGAGQAYQQQSQQGQLYMTYDPIQANYLQSSGVMQRGPAAPMQNSVVPGLQPSSSYYTGSTGAQTGFFQQPGNSSLPSAALQHQQHQGGYGLQGNVFGNPSQTHANAGLQNFGSHFLSSPMQIAAALSAQQYRSTNLANPAYVKSVGGQHMGDQNSRQLKSPGSQQDVLSSVFNSAPQIPSPKIRQNSKQPPPQPSPTAQHKYNLYQSVGNQSQQRYPTPIQRPVNFQSTVGSAQNNSNRHRSNNQNNKLPPRHYYGGQGAHMNTHHEKKDDNSSKLIESNITPATNNAGNINTSSSISKTGIATNVPVTANKQQSVEVKDGNKEEANVVKD